MLRAVDDFDECPNIKSYTHIHVYTGTRKTGTTDVLLTFSLFLFRFLSRSRGYLLLLGATLSLSFASSE